MIQFRFLVENSGKLVCFHCGGEVPEGSDYDHVTGGTVALRLSELGII